MLKLYHNDMSSCAQKVRFVLHEKGVEWESEELNLRIGEQLKPEFLKINPKGLVPALEHDGKILIESNVIIEYLNEVFPEPALLPTDPYSRALQNSLPLSMLSSDGSIVNRLRQSIPSNFSFIEEINLCH